MTAHSGRRKHDTARETLSIPRRCRIGRGIQAVLSNNRDCPRSIEPFSRRYTRPKTDTVSYVSLSALCKGIGLARGGYMGYRILTDQVLSPFGYNKTPTWSNTTGSRSNTGDTRREANYITGSLAMPCGRWWSGRWRSWPAAAEQLARLSGARSIRVRRQRRRAIYSSGGRGAHRCRRAAGNGDDGSVLDLGYADAPDANYTVGALMHRAGGRISIADVERFSGHAWRARQADQGHG